MAFKLTLCLFQDPISESHQELNFTIKETMCLLEDVIFFDECDFKEDGVSY